MTKTVKARIAAAVDAEGTIGIMLIDADGEQQAFRWACDHLRDGEARYIVEVELPLPQPQVIAAKAEPAPL